MIKRIHVNQQNIRHNAKNPYDERPVFTVKTYNANTKGMTVTIGGPSRLKYSPDKPLSRGAKVWLPWGAKVWIETESIVEVDGVKV
jgi:hypothetical protein